MSKYQQSGREREEIPQVQSDLQAYTLLLSRDVLCCHFWTIVFFPWPFSYFPPKCLKNPIICILNQTFKLARIWTQLSDFPLMVKLSYKKRHFQNIGSLFPAHGNSCCDAPSCFWLSEDEQSWRISNLIKLLRNSLFSICMQGSFLLPNDTLYAISVCFWRVVGILFGI